jgi:hypothetical protein
MVEERGDPDDVKVELSYSNRTFLDRFTANCLKGLNADELLDKPDITELDEFTAMLRIIVVHNSLMTRLELEYTKKGGLVKVGPPHKEETTSQDRSGQSLVVPELRAEFKNLHSVHHKCEALLHLVEKCLQLEMVRRWF